jgi:kynurenine formamidase
MTCYQGYTGNGGIVGRGVLLDYFAWATRKGIEYNPMSRHCITVTDLEAIAKDENVSLCAGDILIVRTGWVKWYEEHGDEERLKHITNGKEWVGVEGCQETVEWLWNRHFAAVAADSIGFEVWPAAPGYSEPVLKYNIRKKAKGLISHRAS